MVTLNAVLVLICCKTSDTALLFLVIQQPSIGVAFVVVVLGLYIWS